MPRPPFRIREIADFGERRPLIGVVYGDYSAAGFARLVYLRFGEAWAAAKADDGCAVPDSLDD